MSFNSFGLAAEILRVVSEQGYTEPTPIQHRGIPAILTGRDIMASAQTGTGKTACFTLPMLHRLQAGTNSNNQQHGKRHIRALILVPTRELAAQVQESVRTYGKYLQLRSTVVVGGVKINPQIQALRKGVDILVATPGRLLDHVEQRTVDLSRIEILVLDEADRMLDMGFIPAIRKIISLIPAQRQNLMFSATFSEEIKGLANKILRSPEAIHFAHHNIAADGVTHVIHPVDHSRKRELLIHLIESKKWQQVLVFTGRKHGANRLAQQLDKAGISATSIHGDKSQAQRTRALADFKKYKVQVLVGTDVASRGLDIEQLPHVVNFELPNVPEDYVHRIGRTGRAGNEGEAVSLVAHSEMGLLKNIEQLLKRPLPQVVVTGFEPDPNIAHPVSAQTGYQAHGHRNGSTGRHNGHVHRGGGKHSPGARNHRRRRPGSGERPHAG